MPAQPPKRPSPKTSTKKRTRGRPPSSNPKTVMVAAKVDRKTAADLDKLCQRFKGRRADLLRWAIEDAIEGKWVPSQFRGR